MAIDCTDAFVAIGSEDFERSVAFYAAALGRRPDERVGDTYAVFRLPGLRLGIFRPRPGDVAGFRNPGPTRGGLSLVLQVASVAEAAAELARLNAPPPGPAREVAGGREIHAQDLDGNRLILVERA